MVVEFPRKNVYAAFVLTVLCLYLGWSWVQAGWGKAGFNAGKLGFDHFIIPFLKRQMIKIEEQENLPQSV